MISLFFLRQKKAVAKTMRRLYQRQLTTASGGNISVRKASYLIITPSQIDKGALTYRNIAILTLEGKNLTPRVKTSMESEMHRLIYQTRPDVNAIVHAHPPFATVFTAEPNLLNTKITGESYFVLGEIGFAPYRMMGSLQLAEITAEIAQKHNVIFLQHHGVVALGKELTEAFDRMEVVENIAKTTTARKILGIEAYIPENEIENIKNKFNLP